MRFVVALAIGAAVPACSLLVTTSDLSSGGPGGPDGSSSGSSSSGTDGAIVDVDGNLINPTDADTSDVVVVPEGGSEHCPGGKGAVMIDTGTYCIDSTEITQLHYQTFLNAAPSPVSQEQRCAFNTSFMPDPTCTNGGFNSVNFPNIPVTCINWCDASAFCAWAGKRVCHNDEWLGACTNDHKQAFPYPGDFNKSNCNGPDNPSAKGQILAVSALKTCEGGYPGLFDMAGNVTELEGDCPGDACNRRGGSFDSSSAAKCEFLLAGPLDFHTAFVGSRCCADRH